MSRYEADANYLLRPSLPWQVESLHRLCELSQEELAALIGPINAKQVRECKAPRAPEHKRPP